MRAPHKHAELIKAWADGAVLQKRYICGAIGEIYLWEIFDGDWSYCADYEFRIKPEKKPDEIRYFKLTAGANLIYAVKETANIKIIWDGETGKLKDSEVLK